MSTALRTASRSFVSSTATDVGLWEAHPGTDVDVESDEVFVVLTGAGSVSFEDGSSIALRPGVLVRLHEGDRTTWAVAERLRKLYIA
ncbi:cupin domain-containing protein [Prescottella agglutinans]|uniref:cupin domain-containing protein n=1 Tax=Prescottella agglutinans TaxID=1644129 RepID=UPI002474D31A|nr:cupin domain-containing protein [Prescottella agglutinans]